MADRSADICRRLYCADTKPVPTAPGPPKSAQVVRPAGPLNTMSTRYRDGLEGARLIPAVLSENAIRCSGVNRRWRVRVMNDDALADRRRPSEDDYFRKHDNQLIEEARQRAERTRRGTPTHVRAGRHRGQRIVANKRRRPSETATPRSCSNAAPRLPLPQEGCSDLARSPAANVRYWITFAMCWNRRHISATTRLRKRCRATG
jgi:hypothetical protein